MKKDKLIVLMILFFFFCILFYIKVWEYRNPATKLDDVIIVKIIPYHTRLGDLRWLSEGYQIYISGEERPIYFRKNSWDTTIRINDKVTVVVRKGCLNNQLDGLDVIKTNLTDQ